ncbi:MAG TPA: right-handed parallel beta-helix repeat-containing protein [Candidatus Methanoperedens sp.]|nr:right-handed parallel beta-helix repeat-containing protein [Candidatus Methanoperedens sp.]
MSRLRMREVRRTLVVACLVAAGCAHGGRPAAREIVWEGSMTVREDVIVGAGELLVVRPGTRVTFVFRDGDGDGLGDARILVRGGIDARGSAAAPITFAAERPGADRGPGWTEILIEDGSRARFEHCRFSGARQAVHAHRTPLVVERCRFEDNAIGVRFTGDPVAIRRSAFARNGTALRYWESSPEITGNGFEGNGTAVFVREGSARSVLAGNNFLASADYHVKLGESQHADVDAGGNWWGSARPDDVERLIFDRLDADYLGRVRYDAPAPEPLRLEAP